jgi:pilus assembly protein CpaE
MTAVTLVSSRDRLLEDLLRASDMQVSIADPAELASLANPSARQPDAIVIDLRNEVTIPPAVTAIRRQHPTTGIVIITSILDPTLLLEAMRAGVNEVVSEPLRQDDLERAVDRVAGQRPRGDVGRLVAFVGAKGGVGATTLAVNVAAALSTLAAPSKGSSGGASASSHGRALLMDLHLTGGDAAVFLGVEPRFSLVDAVENTRRLDRTFFRSLVTHALPNLDLLASPERAGLGRIESERIRPVIDFVAGEYAHTVLDLPHSDPAALDSLDVVNVIVIVVNQELATVRSASRLVTFLKQRYGQEKLNLVLTRSDRQADIGQEDVERATGLEVACTFPSDYRRALLALNKGRPLTFDNHNDLSSAFNRYASQLAGVHAKPRPERHAGLFGRLGRKN